jgi:hypothetical protein
VVVVVVVAVAAAAVAAVVKNAKFRVTQHRYMIQHDNTTNQRNNTYTYSSTVRTYFVRVCVMPRLL